MILKTNNVTYSYLTRDQIDTSQYFKFLEFHHGSGAFATWRERLLWYFSLGNDSYRILVAKVDDEYVGQSCAYKVPAMVHNDEMIWWWGVDSFVLPHMRGKGIGKHMQERLHKDLPNFSSAWYSPTNGYIKRKCGGHCILEFPFAYYPVSCFCTIMAELALKKVISRKIKLPRVRLPFIYARLNGCGRSRIQQYHTEEIDVTQLPVMSDFIEDCLKDTQFHVVRSRQYLKWKYVDNPRIHCHVISVSHNGKRVGIAVFSDMRNRGVVMAKANVVKIYESLYTKESGLSQRKMLELIINYFRQKNLLLDGVLSLQKIDYRPMLIYPRPSSELLSTLQIEKLDSGYLTYSDQDME